MHPAFDGTWFIEEMLFRETWKKEMREAWGKKGRGQAKMWSYGLRESLPLADPLGGCYVLREWSPPGTEEDLGGVPALMTTQIKPKIVDLMAPIIAKNHCQFIWSFDRNKEHNRGIIFYISFLFIRKIRTLYSHFAFTCINILMSL